MHGLMEGLDPALMDSLYPPLFCPDLENFRVVGGKWETRLGQALFKNVGGSGSPRLLENLYQSTAVSGTPVTGQTTRIAIRGENAVAQFYEYKAESDTSFVAVGAANLGAALTATQPYFQGTTLGDQFIFTDRSGSLRKYTRANASAGAIATITNGTAPASAPTVTSRWYDRLETWTTPANWAASGSITLTDTTSTAPPPGGGRSVNALITNTGGTGATLTANTTAVPQPTSVPSHTIAFWLYQRIDTKTFTQLGLGINGPDEYNLPLRCQVLNSWEPFFFPIGDIGTINYARIRVLDATRAPNGEILSALYLPGRLEGAYRWIYTYYTAATGIETAPSAISNNGIASDFSAIGVTNDQNSGRAFQKAAALRFTHNPGTADKIRIYRSGGVPELTKDSRGFDVWYRVGEIYDVTTTLNGGVSAAATAITVASATHIAVGDTLVIEPGVATKEEYVKVTSIASAPTLAVKGMDRDNGLLNAHSNGVTVQMAFVDNVANETIDVTQPVDIQRQDPPLGALFVQKSPEGRLWIFGYKDNPTGVAISNRATPDRTADYFTFPSGVDPLTRRSLTQGWQFKVGGDNTDEAIVWGGFYQGLAHILTKRHMYVVEAQSQTDWGPIAVQKILNVGCIAGDTVREVNGALMWVADGPRVVKWEGRGRAPEIVSHLRINERLNAAPTARWNQWFAVYHAKQKGNYYCLYFVPDGQTTCTQRLDYDFDSDAWEPVVYYDDDGDPLGFGAAVVRDGGGDVRDLYQMDTSGNVWQAETGLLDGTVPIQLRAKTKRYPLAIFSRYPSGALGDVAPGSSRHVLLGQVTMLMQLFVRYEGITDSISITVRVGGSEYGETSHTYTLDMSGTGDQDKKFRLHRDLYGRWAQITLTGSVSNRPSIRECIVWGMPVRSGSVHT